MPRVDRVAVHVAAAWPRADVGERLLPVMFDAEQIHVVVRIVAAIDERNAMVQLDALAHNALGRAERAERPQLTDALALPLKPPPPDPLGRHEGGFSSMPRGSSSLVPEIPESPRSLLLFPTLIK